jgi:GNAT superfamily N-acetyltransferase
MDFGTLTYQDLERIRHLQPEDWPDIMPHFDFYANSPFCFPIRAEIDGRIVGIGASVHFDHTAWLAHIIVDDHFRNRGIGYQIVCELLAEVKKDAIETCSLVATSFGQPVYKKAGFRVVSEYSFMTRAMPWTVQPASDKVFSFREEYRLMIYAIDKQVSGENRERLLSCYVDSSMVYLDDGKVMGYYIPGLNEGMIVANTKEAGTALMKIKYSTTDNAVLPSDNHTGMNFLQQNGFIQTERKGVRMILGKDIHWQPSAVYSRIGGNLG